jgi:hypothetical protein
MPRGLAAVLGEHNEIIAVTPGGDRDPEIEERHPAISAELSREARPPLAVFLISILG